LDIYSFRIVVDSVDTCYRVLGQMHALYKPRPFQVKDYIAVPKTNGYQSLHTSMIGPKGVPVDVLIRTEEMDQMARLGVAAHWGYQDHYNTSVQVRAQQWLQSIVELQQSAGNSQEFIENVKSDLFSSDIYVFTPKGRIVQLPANATPIDFAYALHSDIGNHCVGAIVDHQQHPLSEPLQSGQTIEILTEPDVYPHSSWLQFVVSGKARSQIRQALKHSGQNEESEVKPAENCPICAEICLYLLNQSGVLANITSTLAAMNCNILSISSAPAQSETGCFTLQINVQGQEHLNTVLRKLQSVSGVVKAVEIGQ
jgi:guanosine-3',5'-bis(diphosphate) 3'-pyrophosphohydrolase